jgi:predicted dinucleotide-binding enzyme
MRIAILGAGNVGGALAATWQEKGHEVTVSTRETVAETAASGEVVVLAVPAGAVREVLAQAGPLEDSILLDATNNIGGGPAGTDIAALAPNARYVKAFNTVFATFMHRAPSDSAASVVYCGDDREAKRAAARLIIDAGFEAVDAGSLNETPLVEAFAKLLTGIAYRRGRGPFVYHFDIR